MAGCLGSLLSLIILAVISAIIGYIVKSATDIEIMFWITSIGVFLLGFVGFLIGSIFDIIGGIFGGGDE